MSLCIWTLVSCVNTPLSSWLSSRFCKPHAGSLYLPTGAAHTGEKHLWEVPVWGALAVAVPTSEHSEAVHFRVTMTFFGGKPALGSTIFQKNEGLVDIPDWMAGCKKDGRLAESSFCFLFRSPNYVNLETVSINCPIRHLVITLYRNIPNHSGKGWVHYFIVSQIKI